MSEKNVTVSKEDFEKMQQLIREQEKRREMYKKNSARRNARLMIFQKKAEAAGLSVTEEEITAYLNG